MITTSAEPAIEAIDASVVLGGRAVWHGVDVSIAPGEFTAVLGPNGVGKSTFIKAVLGLLPLAAGQLHVLGAPAGQRNRDIGYLPQRRSFDAGLRVRGIDIVGLGLDGDRWGLPGRQLSSGRRRERKRRVGEVVELVGATAFADRPIGEISGGEQQRLLIAQALVREPSVLLLDEPLDSLDLPNQAAVAALVSTVCRDQGVTVLLVAHDVNPIESYLDRVIYLAHGEAVTGRPDEVITTETLSRLYDTPIEVLRTSDGRLVVVGQPEAPAHHSNRHAH
jgi:zinc/manganese transport system ATP-binding protein